MHITSTAFAAGDPIPARYTCDGVDRSPPLRIAGLPEGTVTLVLVMDDPDAPRGTWDHWVEYDIAPVDEIGEGVEGLGTRGLNSWGSPGYRGPCPPSGRHRYVFAAYALDAELGLAPGAEKAAVLQAMDGHVLDSATLTGTYARS